MSLTTSAGELNQAMKTAGLIWDQVREGWRDAVAEEFEERHWKPISESVEAAAEAMDRVAPILARMYRECS